MSKKTLLIVSCLVGFGAVAVAGSQERIQSILGNVYLQSATPGTVQAGHASITGTFRAGQVVVSNSNSATIPIVGNNTATTGTSIGGSFSSASPHGIAVRGTATFPDGTSHGVSGESRSEFGEGVTGLATGFFGVGVRGIGAYAVQGDSHGVNGIGGRFSSDGTGSRAVYATAGVNSALCASFTYAGVSGGFAVYGQASGATGSNVGGYFTAASPSGKGVYALASSTSGTTHAVFADQRSSTGYGVYGIIPLAANGKAIFGGGGTSGSGYAGYFSGRMITTGTKAFQIDDPRNPDSAYLNHYCTEGPEPLNEYRGNVVLDGRGEAWITLPDYFDQINKDPSYTLTAVGAAMPGLYVSRKVSDNRFKVAGGAPGKEVSWRVSAVRNDKFVRTYGAPVEQSKPREARGTYLHPELYGQPESKSEFYAVPPTDIGAKQ